MVVNHVVLFDASDITFDTFDLVKHSSSCSRRTPQGHLLKVPGLTVGNIFAQLVVGPVRVGFHCSDVCSKWASLVCLTLGFQLQPGNMMNFSLETMKSRGFSMISGDVIQLLKMDTLQIPPKALIRSPRPLE